MIIMKFGGTSLANAERIRHVAELVETHLPERPLLVLSAMGTTTDDLIAAGNSALKGTIDSAKIHSRYFETLEALKVPQGALEPLFAELEGLLRGISLIKELSPRTFAYLLSFGERLSIRLFAAYLQGRGIAAEPFEAWDFGILTDSDFKNASVLPETFENIKEKYALLGASTLPVITGFIAKDAHGSITTLGRGGSDLTAAILGAALNVREIQVWKDVQGILTTDPRLVSSARPVAYLSFEEASELAYFGAKVLHPRSILPAMKKGVPVRVKNVYAPRHPGTLIRDVLPEKREDLVTGITLKQDQVLMHLSSTRMLGQYGFLAKVFQIFADLKIVVDVIATSEVSISLTLDTREGLEKLTELLQEIATVNTYAHQTTISMIGSQTKAPKILELALKTLSSKNIAVAMISLGASLINTNLVVSDKDAKQALESLHELFFSDLTEDII
jgi:aspartate kinase